MLIAEGGPSRKARRFLVLLADGHHLVLEGSVELLFLAQDWHRKRDHQFLAFHFRCQALVRRTFPPRPQLLCANRLRRLNYVAENLRAVATAALLLRGSVRTHG